MDRDQQSKQVIEQIHSALRNLSGDTWYKRFQLNKLTGVLSSCLVARRLEQNPQEHIYQALKSVLSDILDALERQHLDHALLLRWRFWEGFSVKQILHGDIKYVQLGLAMSERQFYRVQEQAIASFALLFWQMEESCSRNLDQSPQTNEPSNINVYQPITHLSRLSRHEIIVLELVSKGLTARETAYELGYSTRYVERTLTEIRIKLGAKNTAHALVLAIDQGLIRLRG